MHASDLEIVFHGLDHSDAVENRVREEAQKLEGLLERAVSGTVRLEVPHRHQSQGRRYEVHIHFSLPGVDDVVVSHAPGREEDREDLYKAIRQAFNAARRQLKEKVEKLRGKVKNHNRQGAAASGAGSEAL